jgi:hypothetical protein
MREEEFLLDLVYLVVIQDTVQLLIVTLVHLLKQPQHTADVTVIGVVRRCSFFDLLHYQDILGQSLHRLDQKILNGQQFVRRVEPSLIEEVGEVLPLHQRIDEGGTVRVIIQVFEVHLEEVDLLLHLLEDDLVVPVLAGLLENSDEEELIQTTDLIDVHEDSLRLLTSYDLLV